MEGRQCEEMGTTPEMLPGRGTFGKRREGTIAGWDFRSKEDFLSLLWVCLCLTMGVDRWSLNDLGQNPAGQWL